ncbi:hypothetical protein H4P12_14090 [Paracoccus sp. 11-3]|uniref:Uncharacterized protein n=1 Tax=Paracoccus amoyensis TaxID=2760093 RepID=A0A926J6Z7_9RHOB|nr:hypothetical protein [Paracoccus amoyensis]MBC9247807.1 hypothetical protein [Paracoccus amoyensis]
MTQNKKQVGGPQNMQIASPIPAAYLTDATRMWWRSFGPRRLQRRLPSVCPAHGVAAIDGRGELAGIMGLRDSDGGFLLTQSLAVRWLYRAAPPTGDLVIDGIVTRNRRAAPGAHFWSKVWPARNRPTAPD